MEFKAPSAALRFSESLFCSVNMNKRRKSIGLAEIFLGAARAEKSARAVDSMDDVDDVEK